MIGDILEDVEGIEFVRFGGEDVVRHKLVQRIVAAYNEYAEQQAPRARAQARAPAALSRLMSIELDRRPGASCAAPAALAALARRRRRATATWRSRSWTEDEIQRAEPRAPRASTRPTDVLSFPVDERGSDGRAARAGRRGDLPRAHRRT